MLEVSQGGQLVRQDYAFSHHLVVLLQRLYHFKYTSLVQDL